MSDNVIALFRRPSTNHRPLGALLQSFSNNRRDNCDVFWLKENAEVLSTLQNQKADISSTDIDCYSDFYASLADRIAFFPQYYRFFISIAADLEAIGMAGQEAERLCHFAHHNNLAHAELSDLQRAEATALLARRDITLDTTPSLHQRLVGFIEHSPSFALPNRKIAYELTHIVIYLSEYGARDPKLSPAAIQSLMFTGILAHLEQNMDLLAEVCVALRFSKQTPPKAWEESILSLARSFKLVPNDPGHGDQYHEYLVVNWACSLMGGDAFSGGYTANGTGFYATTEPGNALRDVSHALFSWTGARSARWDLMEPQLFDARPAASSDHLRDVVRATSEFGAFFEHFVRAPNAVVPRVERRVEQSDVALQERQR
jgi:hypothetical protein